MAGGAAADGPKVDTAEMVYISSLALLKVCRLFVCNFCLLPFARPPARYRLAPLRDPALVFD